MKNEADVVAIIARILKNETEVTRAVTPEAHLLRDLEMDSLSLTVLAVGLEDEFRIRLTEEDTGGIETVQQLAALVVRRMGEAGDGSSGARGGAEASAGDSRERRNAAAAANHRERVGPAAGDQGERSNAAPGSDHRDEREAAHTRRAQS